MTVVPAAPATAAGAGAPACCSILPFMYRTCAICAATVSVVQPRASANAWNAGSAANCSRRCFATARSSADAGAPEDVDADVDADAAEPWEPWDPEPDWDWLPPGDDASREANRAPVCAYPANAPAPAPNVLGPVFEKRVNAPKPVGGAGAGAGAGVGDADADALADLFVACWGPWRAGDDVPGASSVSEPLSCDA